MSVFWSTILERVRIFLIVSEDGDFGKKYCIDRYNKGSSFRVDMAAKRHKNHKIKILHYIISVGYEIETR